MRDGIGGGCQGCARSGDLRVGHERRWPTWTPPAEMIARQLELEPCSAENGGQPPGADNPSGARAFHQLQGGVDTLYHIHGDPDPRSIGRAVSSGCIRMLNHDVIDLHVRVEDGARVVVRPSMPPSEPSQVGPARQVATPAELASAPSTRVPSLETRS